MITMTLVVTPKKLKNEDNLPDTGGKHRNKHSRKYAERSSQFYGPDKSVEIWKVARKIIVMNITVTTRYELA